MSKRFIYPGVRGKPVEVDPGIYHADKVSFDTYLSWNAISNSSLSAAIVDAREHVINMEEYFRQQPLEETRAMRFGKWAHAAKFEFQRAIEDYDILPDFTQYRILDDWSLEEAPCLTKAGKPASEPKATSDYDARVAKYKSNPAKIGKTFIEAEYANRLSQMLYRLDNHERAAEYFANHGVGTDRELSIVWIDIESGLKCKARIDCVQHGQLRTVDLKSTEKKLGDFARTIANMGYHRQGAWYSDGMKAVTGEAYRPAIVAAETLPQHGVMAAPLSLAAITAGRIVYRDLLQRIKAGIESGDWKSYDSPKEWDLPAWATPLVPLKP